MSSFTPTCVACCSNLSEKSLCRVVVGPTAVKVCSGLFHRLQMVQRAARLYDYSPYSTPKPGMSIKTIGFLDLSIIWYSKNNTLFQKLDLFTFTGGKVPTQLDL